jgi:hypothetical protein
MSTTPAIDRIISGLPIKDGLDKAKAAQTARVMIQAGIEFGPINDLPRAQDAGTRQTEQELRDLIEHAVRLGHHILDMHSPALRAVEARSPKVEPLNLVDLLRSLAKAAESAINQPTTDAAPVLRGRRSNRKASDLADVARDAYEYYTGKRATITTDPITYKRSGEFLDFLSAVFDVAGVDADPVHYARKLQG